jgi:hypothetical protein
MKDLKYRTSNIERRTLNGIAADAGLIRRSVFDVQRSMFSDK